MSEAATVEGCQCGHARTLHQPDTGECWGFILDADSQYCRCPGYVESDAPA